MLLCERLGTTSLDANDSQFCSAAVTGEGLRIEWKMCKFASFVCCGQARELCDAAGEKNNIISARPRTNHRERPGLISAIHLNISFLCFRLRLANLT